MSYPPFVCCSMLQLPQHPALWRVRQRLRTSCGWRRKCGKSSRAPAIRGRWKRCWKSGSAWAEDGWLRSRYGGFKMIMEAWYWTCSMLRISDDVPLVWMMMVVMVMMMVSLPVACFLAAFQGFLESRKPKRCKASCGMHCLKPTSQGRWSRSWMRPLAFVFGFRSNYSRPGKLVYSRGMGANWKKDLKRACRFQIQVYSA